MGDVPIREECHFYSLQILLIIIEAYYFDDMGRVLLACNWFDDWIGLMTGLDQGLFLPNCKSVSVLC